MAEETEEPGGDPLENASDLELQEFDSADTPAAQSGDDGDEPGQEGGEQKIAADLVPVFDVPVRISAVLGRTAIDVSSLLQLSQGSVLELDRKIGEAIDIFVNNRLVARGEVVVVEDRLGVTMTEIIKGGDGG